MGVILWTNDMVWRGGHLLVSPGIEQGLLQTKRGIIPFSASIVARVPETWVFFYVWAKVTVWRGG